MPKSQAQLAVLSALLLTLAGTVWYFNGGSAPATAPASSEPTASTTNAPPRAIPVSGLDLEALNARADTVSDVTRNPFRFRPRPVAVPRVVTAPSSQPVAPPPPVPTGPPPPPPIPLKFIGVLDAPARLGRLAILSDSRGGVFYGKEGDTIEGRYRVLRISPESAELAYIDGRGRQTIRLTGQ